MCDKKTAHSMPETFEFEFFHQTTPPGPIRDILAPFSLLMILHGVIHVLKRLPGVLDTRSCNKNNVVRKILKT